MSPRVLKVIGSGLLLLIVTAEIEAAPYTGSQPGQKAIIQGHGLVLDLAFSPDSKLLAVANVFNQEVRLWDVVAGKVTATLPHRDAIRVLFSPDGKIVATSGKHLKLWDVASRKELATFKYVYPHWMLFSADGKKLAVIRKKMMTILNLETKEEEQTYDIDPSRLMVAAYPSWKRPVYAMSRGKEKPIALMDPFTNKEVVTCENDLQLTSSLLASDREEKILVGGCREDRGIGIRGLRDEIRLWDRKTGKKIAALESPSRFSGAVAISPDGKILALHRMELLWTNAFFTKHEDGGIHFCEIPSGRFLSFQKISCVFEGSEGSYGRHVLVFSPDGRMLAIESAFNVYLWSLPDAWRKKK